MKNTTPLPAAEEPDDEYRGYNNGEVKQPLSLIIYKKAKE